MRLTALAAVVFVAGSCSPASLADGLPNAFYAMDTCTKHPYPRNDITPARQFDLLKELGYAGIGWTEESPEQVASAVAEAEARGLKMYTIYCSATVTADGTLRPSALIDPIMEALRGHGTLIWLHIGGKGPGIGTLTHDSPVIGQLRALAARAEANGLAVAIYPHIGDWAERFEDALRVARLVDCKNFGVTFNLCHTLAAGDEESVPALLEKAGSSLLAVTINGADAGVKGPQWNRLIQTLDRGSYNVGNVLHALKRVGYQGPIGLQGYGLSGDRRDNLARSMSAWRRLSESTRERRLP
jgi:sugar phosphate isomerase/epimerase